MFKLSKPTRQQTIRGAEAIVVTYLVAAFAVWRTQPDKFSKAALVAAGVAGLQAVYQLAKGFLTTL